MLVGAPPAFAGIWLGVVRRSSPGNRITLALRPAVGIGPDNRPLRPTCEQRVILPESIFLNPVVVLSSAKISVLDGINPDLRAMIGAWRHSQKKPVEPLVTFSKISRGSCAQR